MSIISALYAGSSGMAAMGMAMQVIGNNIANINTVGFKASRTQFADVLSQAINTPAGKKQVGRGVRVAAIEGLFNQGSFESTPLVTDVALNGSGWFVLTTGPETLYSRAGTFRINKDGDLVNSLGMNVNGFLYDLSGQPTGVRDIINLSTATAPPNPTGDGAVQGTGVFMNINLAASEPVIDNATTPFDSTDPSGTSNFSTSMTVYDSLGVGHTVSVYFKRIDAVGAPAPAPGTQNLWEWHALVDGVEVQGGTPGVNVEGAAGTLEFDTNGVLLTAPQSFTVPSDWSFAGGSTPNQVIGFDFSGSTQVGVDPSGVNSLTQDGFSAGNLQAIDIDRLGIITGVFSNGRARPLAQLAIASFPAENELFRVGDSLFIESIASGQAVYGVANSGSNGTIAGSTLELSNVDLTTEFINMIITQKGFQANAKIITTGDQMLETVIQMKR